jgi:hypothetical protein
MITTFILIFTAILILVVLAALAGPFPKPVVVFLVSVFVITTILSLVF